VDLAVGNRPYLLHCDFQFRNCCWLRTKLSKKVRTYPKHGISRVFKTGEN